MPQINIYHFLSQTSWTILLFLFFFYLMKQYILPSLLEVIKLKSYILFNTSPKSNFTLNLPYFKSYKF